AWEGDQHREGVRGLDERAERGALQAEEQIAFPVAGHGSVFGLGGPFADHYLGRHVRPGLLPGPGSWDPKRPAGPQACDELALERTSALDVEGLVDGLVADPHGLIIGELDLQPLGDLLGAPSLHPTAVPAVRLVLAVPSRPRRPDCAAIRKLHSSREPVPHPDAEPVVDTQLRKLRATSTPLGMPLCERRPILETKRPCRRVAAQLPRDRRRRPAEPTRDLAHTELLRTPDRNVLTLREGQIPARHRRRQARVHAASVTEPPEPDRR